MCSTTHPHKSKHAHAFLFSGSLTLTLSVIPKLFRLHTLALSPTHTQAHTLTFFVVNVEKDSRRRKLGFAFLKRKKCLFKAGRELQQSLSWAPQHLIQLEASDISILSNPELSNVLSYTRDDKIAPVVSWYLCELL